MELGLYLKISSLINVVALLALIVMGYFVCKLWRENKAVTKGMKGVIEMLRAGIVTEVEDAIESEDYIEDDDDFIDIKGLS
jgi:drug/metabolite transporter superfamily protein YnfA